MTVFWLVPTACSKGSRLMLLTKVKRERAWKSAGAAGNISPMEPYLLLVTLVLGQQAPHSYKVEFSSKETCERAATTATLEKFMKQAEPLRSQVARKK
jgi:hypothetical protein